MSRNTITTSFSSQTVQMQQVRNVVITTYEDCASMSVYAEKSVLNEVERTMSVYAWNFRNNHQRRIWVIAIMTAVRCLLLVDTEYGDARLNARFETADDLAAAALTVAQERHS